VVLERGQDGTASTATVYDFKTARIEAAQVADLKGAYDDQMRLYRQAVARLSGLPLGKVRGVLVFTRLRLCVPAGC
jgi:ATP-dependent exoDNAse (exonuclease V) beta subunit